MFSFLFNFEKWYYSFKYKKHTTNKFDLICSQAHKIFDRVHDIDLMTLDSEAIGQVWQMFI